MLSARKIGLVLLAGVGAGAAKNTAAHSRFWDLALTAVFATIIALPGSGMFLGLGKDFDPVLESRHPEPPPRFEMRKYGSFSVPTPANLRSFPVMFEPYFKDRHAFRREAMEAYLWSRVHGLTTVSQESRRTTRDLDAKPGFESTLPAVVLGKDGWLFLAADRSIEGYRHVLPISFEQLERCRLNLEEKQARLQERGIDFLLVIAPDKGTIYAEYLPGYARATDAPSRLDQFLEHLRSRSTLQVLDLRPTLFKAKQRHQVYHKTDPHWNDIGAQAGCRAILEAMHHPAAMHEDFEQYRLVDRLCETGDERRILGGVVGPEQTIALEPRLPRHATGTAFTNFNWLSSYVSVNPQAPPITAFVLHDSFYVGIAPFFNEHFRIVHSSGLPTLDGSYPLESIVNAQPKVVMHILVERKLNLLE
jgi:hypothetical protein